MRRLKNIKWLPILMALTILAIAAFQFYWLQKAYEREQRTLEIRTNIMFRETVRSLQASKLKLDGILADSSKPGRIIAHKEFSHGPLRYKMPRQKMIGTFDALMQKAKDSEHGTSVVLHKPFDSVPYPRKNF